MEINFQMYHNPRCYLKKSQQNESKKQHINYSDILFLLVSPLIPQADQTSMEKSCFVEFEMNTGKIYLCFTGKYLSVFYQNCRKETDT